MEKIIQNKTNTKNKKKKKYKINKKQKQLRTTLTQGPIRNRHLIKNKEETRAACTYAKERRAWRWRQQAKKSDNKETKITK